MHWNTLTNLDELQNIEAESKVEKVFIFKHSTRCSISSAALNRIERKWQDEDSKKIKPYYLDLIRYREVSNQIAEDFDVEHESPQLLIIENGKCKFSNTHFDITYDAIMENL